MKSATSNQLMLIGCIIQAVFFFSCGGKSVNTGFNEPRSVVDLSPTIGEDAPGKLVGQKFLKDFGLPVSTVFHHATADTPFYYEDSKLEIFNHVGPHHDAPSHVIKGAKTTDEFSMDQFIGKAKIFDFSAKKKDEPLTRADFEGKGIQAGDIVLAYVGYDPPKDSLSYPSYPYLSGDAAEYVAGLPVKLFATDMPSLANLTNFMRKVSDRDYKDAYDLMPEHLAFARKNVPSIEGLANLDKIIQEEKLVFIGFPLKIKKGNAGPIRAVALVY
jgi:kynurenine formamidase